jgi:ribosome-associated toxin RatA of RatAB toxin-antitoxin module
MSGSLERAPVRLIVGCALAFALTSSIAQPVDDDWIDDALIERGDIQIDFGGERRFRGLVRAAAVIDAPAMRVWRILVDCESVPSFLDSVRSCELVETIDGGRAQLFRQRVKLQWFLPVIEHEFRFDYEPYTRIDVTGVNGPFRRLAGSWWLSEIESQRTRVVHVLELEPGPLLPDFLLTRPMRRDVGDALRMVQLRAQADQPSD